MPEFKNPNQSGGGGGTDSRSFLVMLVVMFAVIFGLRYWQSQHAPEPAAAPAAASSPAAQPAAATTPAASTAAQTVPTVQASAETTTVIENELYKITFTNHGGQVSSWVLKKFTDAKGQPLDLVHQGAARLFGYPLSLYTYDPAITQTLATGLYVPSATGPLQAPATLTFDFAVGNLVVKKAFRFGADYVLHADAVVLRDGQPVRALLAWPAGFGDMDTPAAYVNAALDTSSVNNKSGLLAAFAGNDKHEAYKNISSGATLNGPWDFAGVSDQYFAAIFLPDQPSDATIATFYRNVDAKDTAINDPSAEVHVAGRDTPKGYAKLPIIGAAAGDLSGHDSLRLFVGPKAMPVLKSVHAADGSDLGPVLDFGFWGPVAKLLYFCLHFVQEHLVSNWGWAIIAFTVMINLLLTPLRVQGMRSMLKMQRLQPQTDAIKAKYKNPGPTDPKAAEMNAEIMALQKENGVSMFGGCIPSLIQLPLLIAFFTMMTRVVELRHAHWGWIHDLSAADPWHILPIMMLLTSFAAQYFTPSPGVDPQQQKMMAFMMPVFSAYMTWNYAAALGLYWNVGNLVMITQQQIMNRTALGREMRAMQEERARKRTASSGPLPGGPRPPAKTIQGRR